MEPSRLVNTDAPVSDEGRRITVSFADRSPKESLP